MEPDEIRKNVAYVINELEATAGMKKVFKPWLFERKKELVDEGQRLILEEASKYKFSVLTGKMRMIDEIFEQLDSWKNT